MSKVNMLTDWMQSLAVVEKLNGSVRLHLDFKDLNRVIKRQHYQIPSADDIINKLENKEVFSVVYLKDGFWYVLLNEASSEICTFNSLFGFISTIEIFQKRNQK